MKIVVIGSGAWGTALAIQAAVRHQVTLCARDLHLMQRMAELRENPSYLAGFKLPAGLKLEHLALGGVSNSQSLASADLIVLATPSQATLGWLSALGKTGAQTPVAWLSKGLVRDPAQPAPELLHEAAARVAPGLAVGALSGPSFAQEVAKGLPCALVATSAHSAVVDTLVAAFSSVNLRVYGNPDIVGVELGGAVKNVLAIAAGVCDGLALGANARAALLTRGLAEMARLGQAMGAKPETFMGLSGLGDLVLTATGDLSRNRRVGLGLANGLALPDILSQLGHVAEGVLAASAIEQRAKSLGADMPMTSAVRALLDAEITPAGAVAQLMGRKPADEV